MNSLLFRILYSCVCVYVCCSFDDPLFSYLSDTNWLVQMLLFLFIQFITSSSSSSVYRINKSSTYLSHCLANYCRFTENHETRSTLSFLQCNTIGSARDDKILRISQEMALFSFKYSRQRVHRQRQTASHKQNNQN